MNNINWIVRFKNKAFWIALIPAILLLVQVVAAVFGFTLDLGDLGNKLLDVVNALFAVLTILGIVVDPTTAGTGDSEQAMTCLLYTSDAADDLLCVALGGRGSIKKKKNITIPSTPLTKETTLRQDSQTIRPLITQSR